MSSLSGSVSGGLATPPNGIEDQSKILEESLNVVKVQAFHMKRCLDNNKLMDALKHCSTMLAELRTSSLTPKNYYELYMAIFDELRHLTSFLYEAHMSKRHHLSDLYELVQYAGNIVPRLYLMITVGSVYMRVSKERQTLLAEKGLSPTTEKVDGEEAGGVDEEVPPIKELMRDMLEMARGVQHPTRGLFLRYYLSGMTRDHLPDGDVDGPHGTIDDTIQFILQNFIEMNKLWVRLQHLGHSREREKREQERKELRLLVGSNLVRLSQLDTLDLNMFRNIVLPSILEEIVSCKDVIAQEYLMEVIIQVFQDDFHLRTLDLFLSATAKLSRYVNVKQTVISLIDRFAAYAARARDEAESKGGATKAISGIPDDVQLFDVFWSQITELVQARPEFTIQDIVALLVSLMNLSLNCYPDRLDNVDKVLGFAKDKILEALSNKAMELHTTQTTSSLLQLLLGPISAYKFNPLTILKFPSSATQQLDSTEADELYQQTPSGSPGRSQPPVSTPISLGGNYTDLLFLQPFTTRRQVAHAFAQSAIRAYALVPPEPIPPFRIDTVEAVDAVFGEFCSVMVREQNDGGLFGPKQSLGGDDRESMRRGAVDELPLDWEDIMEEQDMVAKLVHLVKSRDEDPDEDFKLLSAARKHFGEGGEIRIRFTLPSLVMDSIQLGRKYLYSSIEKETKSARLVVLYKFIHQTVLSLSRAREYFAEDEDSGPIFKDDHARSGSNGGMSKIGKGLLSPPDMALRLFLMAAKVADETGHEELAYEFFVQAFTVYEESISESKAQMVAITLIIGTLYTTTIFGFENYETLITKCAVHCSRLLKRVDQCRGVTIVSHLFWAGVSAAGGKDADDDALVRQAREEGRVVYRDGKRVLECLQKALKIADSVMDQTVNVELFVEILERYIWFYEKRNDSITVKYLNSLIDLIQTNLANLDVSAQPAAAGSPYGPLSGSSQSLFAGPSDLPGSIGGGRKVPPHVLKHFANILEYVRLKKEGEAALDVPVIAGGFGGNAGRWGEIDV
ncbi:Vacuolar protein sorting-associated protein 35 [Chytridiales sp. JEL 0842]|nr:Vacuolar protein sorting-associated protein 35 [Chytridiales sp. JEL 0842]